MKLKSQLWGKVLGGLAVTSAVTFGLLVGAVPAHAGGAQCVGASGNLWANQCIFVDGSGTRVNNVRITYNNPGGNICNRYSGTWGTHVSGGQYYKQSVYYGGCVFAASSSAIFTYTDLRLGTTMWGHMNVEGNWIAGIPGVSIQ